MFKISRFLRTSLLIMIATACATPSSNACPLTEPIWAKPPEDPAVDDPPGEGYYFVNDDRSIWASAWWHGEEEPFLRVSEQGIKVAWFRPAGKPLVISGQRIDGSAPPLQAHIPRGYTTRFQASGLAFPAQGCWSVTATAGDSELSFIVWVQPESSLERLSDTDSP